jgi:hypothetical protein
MLFFNDGVHEWNTGIWAEIRERIERSYFTAAFFFHFFCGARDVTHGLTYVKQAPYHFFLIYFSFQNTFRFAKKLKESTENSHMATGTAPLPLQ